MGGGKLGSKLLAVFHGCLAHTVRQPRYPKLIFFGVNHESIALINTFGICQNYYTEHFQFDPSCTPLLGGIQTFLLFFAGDAAGPLYDVGYTRLPVGTNVAPLHRILAICLGHIIVCWV